MKKITIKASVRENGKSVPVGEKVEDYPETLDEAIEFYGSETALLTKAWQTHVIDVQASLRRGGNGQTNLVKRLLEQIASGTAKPEVMEIARKHGLVA